MKKYEIPTPALVVDLDKLQRNINEMAERARKAGVKLRPHIKSHKTPIIAHMQLRAGAIGITCAKLGEAEVMAAAGIEDIFVCYPIIGQENITRLLNLARWVPKISASVDTLEATYALNEAALASGQRIDVIVEIDTGYKRTGVLPGEQAIHFVKEIINSMHGLRYKGLMYMHADTCKYLERDKQLAEERKACQMVVEVARTLRTYGIETGVISGGSTPGAQYMHLVEGLTEYRPGAYVFGDVAYADVGALTLDQIALTILTTVVSVQPAATPDHFVVDAGSKILTHFHPLVTPGYGPIVQMPGVTVSVACEEHGIVRLPPGVKPPALGEKLDIYPNYAGDVVNLSDKLWVVQGDEVIATWDILARGKSV